MKEIIRMARWAPSGDNTQPWRFEVKDDRHFVVHGSDTREHCVYDLQGQGSQIALGALLETIRIAASTLGLACGVTRRPDTPPTAPTFDVELTEIADVQSDPLADHISGRVTQRRPMRTRRLSDQQKEALDEAVGPSHTVVWIDGLMSKMGMANLLFQNAHIRLTTHEAYLVHREVIQWKARFSEDRIPDMAIGLDPVATRLMEYVMRSWGRVRFMNRYLAGTWLPRIQLDLVPALRCGGHFVLVGPTPPESIDDFVAGGGALQRFWLTATKLDLLVQPEMTPLIFAMYARGGVRFTESARALKKAQALSDRLNGFLGEQVCQRAVFMGRIGSGRTPNTRSTRLSVENLLKK